MKTLKSLLTAVGNVQGVVSMDNGTTVLKKINAIWPGSSTSGYISKRSEGRDSNRYLHTQFLGSIIYNRQNVEATLVSIHG